MKQGFFLITLLCLSPAYGQVSPVAQNLRSGLDPQSGTQHQASKKLRTLSAAIYRAAFLSTTAHPNPRKWPSK
jgi:hypothetical protein